MLHLPLDSTSHISAGCSPRITAIPYLLLPVPDTDFREYLEEVRSLAKSFPEIIPAELSLHAGRPGMQPILVFIFMMLRGFLGSVTDKQASRFISESMSLHALLNNLGIEKMPGGSTILDNVNAVTRSTRELILDKQIELVVPASLT